MTSCLLDCGDCCSLVAEVDEDGGIKLSGNPEHPFTAGVMCAKTRRFPARLSHKNRILEPLLRDGDGFRPIGWEEALGLCAERINALRSRPERMAHLRGFGYRGALGRASMEFFRHLGASGLSGSPCDEAGIAACVEDFGTLDHNDPSDLLNARGVINWGKDPIRSSVHLAGLLAKARKAGARLVSVTPGGDGAERFSDTVVRIRPGGDRFLAAALCREMIRRGVSREVADAARDLDKFSALLDGPGWHGPGQVGPDQDNSDPGGLLAAAGVSTEDFRLILDIYLSPEPTATLIGWGVQRHERGGETVRFINAAAFLSGNVGRSGGGAYYNISSGRNLTAWSLGPGPGDERRLFPQHDLGRSLMEADPPVDMMWIDGFNPANQLPDCGAVAKALERCPFVVAVDAFMNDTLARADLILPCALMLEREEIIGSCSHNFINYAAKATNPPGAALSDYEILSRLGRMLSEPVILPPARDCLAASIDNPFVPCDLDELTRRGFVRAKRPEVAFAGLEFGHTDGKYHFPEALSPAREESADWPLKLLTLVDGKFMHSQRPPDEAPGPPGLAVSPDNACLKDLRPGLPVYLATPLGRLEVDLATDESLHPATVTARRGSWAMHGRGLNRIIQARETDMGGGAAFYSQRCRLEN